MPAALNKNWTETRENKVGKKKVTVKSELS